MLQMLRNSAPRNSAFTAHERVSHIVASLGSRSSNRRRRSKVVWWAAVGVAILVNILGSGVPRGIHFTAGGWVSRADAFHAPLEGFGATTSGGSGKPTSYVTNLNDAGPGSFRDAVSSGDRYIVFKVAGTISLKTDVRVYGAFITIDGLSAPSPGITLKNHGLLLLGSNGAHDVIVRGLRVRNSLGCDSCKDYGGGILVGLEAYNIVVDHVSVQGSQNFALSVNKGAWNVTIQWSLLAENQAGAPQLLSLLSGVPSPNGRSSKWVTLHHNAFIKAYERMPKIVYSETGQKANETHVDFSNNLIWDWGWAATYVYKGTRSNVVGNYYYDPNASSNGQKRGIWSCKRDGVSPNCTSTNPKDYAQTYIADNVSGAGDSTSSFLNMLGTDRAPFPAPSVTTSSACDAAKAVLAQAGVRPLDAIDQQYLGMVWLQGCSSSAASAAPMGSSNAVSETGPSLNRVAMAAQAVDMPIAAESHTPSDGLLRFPALSYHNVSAGPGVLPGETEADDALAMEDGAWAAYGPVQMDDYEAFNVRVASGGQGGRLDVRLESPNGPSIGSIPIGNTGGWDSWATVTTRISPTPGLHLVYLTFSTATPGSDEVVLIDRFEFVP